MKRLVEAGHKRWQHFQERRQGITYPEDSDRARLYHFTKDGEVVPNKDVLQRMASIIVDSTKVKPGGKLLTYLSVEDTAGLAYYEAVNTTAHFRGITKIRHLDRRPSIELQRAQMLAQLSPKERVDAIEQLMLQEREVMRWADGVANVRYSANPDFIAQMTSEEKDAYRELQDARMYSPKEGEDQSKKGPEKIRLEDHADEWMGAVKPHPNTAKADSNANRREITHEEQMYYWLKACERNPHEILRQQEKLAVLMSNSRRVRVLSQPVEDNPFFGDPRFVTDITLVTQIVKDGNVVPRRWDNHAGLEKNFPGSEVFGAPSNADSKAEELGQYKESVTGQLAYPFPVMFQGVLLSNISLRYQHGHMVSWEIVGDDVDPEIQKQREHFAKVLEENPCVDLIGEIGIGTSPFPPYNTIDIGLNEKRTGVHFALGMSYKNQKDETGQMADLDNGNSSCAVHADLVMPMTPETPGQLWAEVDVPQSDGSVRQEWTLVLADGAFVKKLDDGQYITDPDLALISIPYAHISAFEAPVFPPFPRENATRRTNTESAESS